MRERALNTPRSENNEAEEVLQVLEQIPPMEKTVRKDSVPLQPNTEQISSLQPMEDPAARQHALKEWRAHTWAGSRQALWPMERSKDTAGTSRRTASPWKGPMLEEFMKETGVQEECKKAGAAKKNYNLHSLSPWAAQDKEDIKESEMKG